eukprot:CAMPEP_0184559980 /NCGR_PEP_ID=MMETSP0199_2-20130426/46706_1 /TAXON_ID=1112570 /ORGANISM="Thraustochytrium sp., Strain LLF1b" /LENGTH=74 /DNA_ID=CAMNT_0026957279 /DNA_START=1224 /DNA_END=1448 /DNA_ORIENTATION=-
MEFTPVEERTAPDRSSAFTRWVTKRYFIASSKNAAFPNARKKESATPILGDASNKPGSARTLSGPSTALLHSVP